MSNLPLLIVTNPWLLWLFKHGWEPSFEGWLQSHVGQVAIASAIYELADQVTDLEVQRQIKIVAARAMVNSAGKMADS